MEIPMKITITARCRGAPARQDKDGHQSGSTQGAGKIS